VFSTDLSFDQAITIVRGLEKSVDTIYWKASVEQKTHTLDPSASRSGRYLIEALFDPSLKFYNVSYTAFPPDDLQDASESKNQLAFDGSQHTFLAHDIRSGGITNNRTDFSSAYVYSGLQFSQEGLLPGLPNIFSFMATSRDNDSKSGLLSSFLMDWKTGKNSFTISEDGVLNIVAEVKLLNTTDCPTTVSLFYDTQRGGGIASAVIKYRQLDENRVEREKELCNWTVETKQNDKGQWVPYKTLYKEFISSGRLFFTLEATFDVVEINPSIKSDQFVLSMPDGYFVDDFTKKLRYKVGVPIDEDRAIEDFMECHGFTGNVPDHMKRGDVFRYALMGIGIIMIIIWLFRIIPRWRGR